MGVFIDAREGTGLVMVPQRLADWVLNQIIQDVPEDIALCQFDCRKGQCSHGEWETCERRLSRAGSELMPALENRQEPAA